MEKYYTPDISEFHVGFEYESSECSREIWKKEIFELDWDNGNELLDIYNEGYQSTHLRVKYLDKEDIESLGWETEDNECFNLQKGFDLYGLYPQLENKYLITKDLKNIFEGIIKNKSEFKKLLQQLGIN